MKIIVLDGHALNPGDLSWGFLEEFGDVTVYDRTSTPEQTVARIGDGEIVLLNKTPLSQAVISACPNLRLICVLATGYNVVDVQAAARRGIPVCNVPGYATDAVAQFTFALLLELCHRVGDHSRGVHQGVWSACPDFCYWETPQLALSGKTMGILGFGSIGQAVGRLAKAFGMNVLTCTRTRRPEGEAVAAYVDWPTLLAQSDVLSLHCPLFPENTGIVNREALAAMKDGAMLINTARGPLVDETALAEALRSGKLRGAAMDVVCQEPIPADNPLLGLPNCILTPHMAWAPEECRRQVLAVTADSIRTFLSGGKVKSVNL